MRGRTNIIDLARGVARNVAGVPLPPCVHRGAAHATDATRVRCHAPGLRLLCGDTVPASFCRACPVRDAIGKPAARPLAPLKVDVATLEQRLAVCAACPHYKGFRCRHPDSGCGCGGGRGMVTAAAFAVARCPENRWPAPVAATPTDPFPTRHLAYFVYPMIGNGVWRRRLEELRRYLPLFTGRRVLAVAVDEHSDTLADVQAFAADWPRIEWIPVANRRDLGEVAGWPALAESVLAPHADEVIYYGHAKGVSRPTDALATPQEWAAVLLEANLGYWPYVARVLQAHPLAGSFRMGPPLHHYSGCGFWARSADLYARDWRAIPQHWGGVELLPTTLYAPHELGAIFWERGSLNLYDAGGWYNIVKPAWRRWQADHSGERTTGVF